MHNHNALLRQVKGVDGIKTGYTDASGYNLVSSVRRDEKHIVAVVLGGTSNAARDARMRQLIEDHISQLRYNGRCRSSQKRTVSPAQMGNGRCILHPRFLGIVSPASMAMTTTFLPMFCAITPQDLEFGDHLDKSGDEMYFGRKVRNMRQVGSRYGRPTPKACELTLAMVRHTSNDELASL